MGEKINIGNHIRAEVIKNLLNAHERLVEDGNAKEVIMLSKFLLRIAEQFDDKLVYSWVKGCNKSTETLESFDELMDESIYETTVKKRAAVNNSQEGGIQINPKEFVRVVQKANCDNA